MQKRMKTLRPMSEYPHGIDNLKVVVYHSWMGCLERACCGFPAYSSLAVGWLYKEENDGFDE